MDEPSAGHCISLKPLVALARSKNATISRLALDCLRRLEAEASAARVQQEAAQALRLVAKTQQQAAAAAVSSTSMAARPAASGIEAMNAIAPNNAPDNPRLRYLMQRLGSRGSRSTEEISVHNIPRLNEFEILSAVPESQPPMHHQEYKVNQRRTAMLFTMKIYPRQLIARRHQLEPRYMSPTNAATLPAALASSAAAAAAAAATTTASATLMKPTISSTIPPSSVVTASSHHQPIPSPSASAPATTRTAPTKPRLASTNPLQADGYRIASVSPISVSGATSSGSGSSSSSASTKHPKMRVSCSLLQDTANSSNLVAEGLLSAGSMTARESFEIAQLVKLVQHPFLAKTLWTYEVADEVSSQLPSLLYTIILTHSLTHSLTQMRQVYLIQDYLSDGQLLIKLRQTNNFVLRWESEAAVFNKDQEFGSSRSSISGRSSGDVRAAFQASRGTETAGAAQTPEAADGGNKLRRSVSDLGRMLDTHTKQYEGAAEARQVVSQTPLIGQAIACRCVGCSKSCPSTSN